MSSSTTKTMFRSKANIPDLPADTPPDPVPVPSAFGGLGARDPRR
jgi:hypothetical protein